MLQYFSWMVVIHHDYVKQINSLIFMDTLLKCQELCLLLLRIPRNKTHSPLFWQIKLRSPPKLQSQATGTGVLCEWRCWSLRNRRRRGCVKVEATGLGLEAWHWGKLCKYMGYESWVYCWLTRWPWSNFSTSLRPIFLLGEVDSASLSAAQSCYGSNCTVHTVMHHINIKAEGRFWRLRWAGRWSRDPGAEGRWMTPYWCVC